MTIGKHIRQSRKLVEWGTEFKDKIARVAQSSAERAGTLVGEMNEHILNEQNFLFTLATIYSSFTCVHDISPV